MNDLVGLMRCAIDQYQMIDAGDRIAVGVSGGKDSMALLACLGELRRFYPKPFDLVAVTLDPQFGTVPTDYTPVAELCRKLKIPYVLRRTQIGSIIFETRKEKNPCSLCARMRRGALHDAAKAEGCNKIALGHHLDDAAETFFMNLMDGGRIACFSPVTYLSRKDLTMIRPMVFAREKEVLRGANRRGLPIVKSRCPAEGTTEREHIKQLLKQLEIRYPKIQEKIIGALQRGAIDGWGKPLPEENEREEDR